MIQQGEGRIQEGDLTAGEEVGKLREMQWETSVVWGGDSLTASQDLNFNWLISSKLFLEDGINQNIDSYSGILEFTILWSGLTVKF